MNSKLILLTLSLILAVMTGPQVFAQSGTLDLTFDADGIYTNDVSATGLDVAYGIAEQADGKIVVAGYTTNNAVTDALVIRMNNDGSPDLSFDADGKVVMDLSLGGSERLYDVLIQPDGKILCAGYIDNGNDLDVVLVRLKSDGSYDNSFGAGGKVQSDFSQGEDDLAFAITLQPDNKIVLAGRSQLAGSSNILVARYTAAGVLDTSFDVDGSVTFDQGNGGDDALYDVEVAADGKILAAGYARFAANQNNMLVVRLDDAGQPDLSFSLDGFFNANLQTGADAFAWALKALPGGQVLIAGSSSLNGNSDAMLMKLKDNGTLDFGFNTDGRAYYDFSLGGTDAFRKLEIQTDGQIIAGGYMQNAITGRDLLAARIDANGDLDPTFGASGWASADVLTNSTDNMRSMALLSDGKIMVGGYSDGLLTLVRFENEAAVGTLDPIQVANQIKTWPQPFSNTLKIELPAGVDEAATLEIFNLNGQLQLSHSLSRLQAGQVLDLSPEASSLGNGIYLLKITGGQSVHTTKLIKQ